MIVSYKTHCPCKVFDANGLEWNRLMWVNTETGEGEQMVVDESGLRQLNPERTGALTQAVRLAAPVLVTPVTPKYSAAEIERRKAELPHDVVWPKCREAREEEEAK